jgi:hypothetical protein
MKINKKYIYPLIAVAIAGGIFLLVTKKKPKSGGNGNTPSEPPIDASEISAEQKKIDAPLNTILANKNANVLIKNKKILSKFVLYFYDNEPSKTPHYGGCKCVRVLLADIHRAGEIACSLLE